MPASDRERLPFFTDMFYLGIFWAEILFQIELQLQVKLLRAFPIMLARGIVCDSRPGADCLHACFPVQRKIQFKGAV